MSNDGEIRLHLEVLGATLRRLRTDRGHSLVDVANGTGLSTSFLSLVENGRSDISTGRLYRVAHFLGVGLADLLDMEPPRGPHIVRATERQAIDIPSEGIHLHPLSDDRATLAMGPLFVTIEPGCEVHDLPQMPDTEHVGFILAGELDLLMDDRETIHLEAGDSVYIPADHHPRHLRNPGAVRMQMVWVPSPPLIGAAQPGEPGRSLR